MTTSEFLSHLRKLDVRIWADGDRLRCDAPKEVLTPDLRAQLAERKAEILAFLRETAAIAHSSPAPIEPVSRDGNLPLSFSQQRMWLLDQLEPDTPTYNISHALRLRGMLDAEALKGSLKEIVTRHEVLRTTFAAVDGEPVQVISSTIDTKLPVEDLSGLPQPERETEARRLALEEKRR